MKSCLNNTLVTRESYDPTPHVGNLVVYTENTHSTMGHLTTLLYADSN